MIVRLLQSFFAIALLAAASVRADELRAGHNYSLTLTDVDQHQLSTSDGHVTIITVVTRQDEEKAQKVGDSVPQIYLGDPKYRLITLVNFQQKIYGPFRGMISAVIRRRMDGEAKELEKTYAAKHLTRDPRRDIFVVSDFDGKAVSQLGISPTATTFAVFVFDGRGRLVRRWSDVPAVDELTAALRQAG